MQIKIEDYRGFQIYFDTVDNRFLCEISDEYKKEFASFMAVKKAVDDFKADNTEFKPFKVRKRDGYSFSKECFEIIGIRKDNRLVIKNPNGDIEQISSYHEDRYVLADSLDESLLIELQQIEENERASDLRFSKDRKEILDKLNLIFLKDYRKTHLS